LRITDKVDISKELLSVTCNCGYSFCFKCHDYELGDHSPARCEWIEEWQSKQKTENENVIWLLQNTKKCPKCKSPIEKTVDVCI